MSWFANNYEVDPLPADYDPTDDEQGGLPAAWAQSRRDEQARTRRNDTNGAGHDEAPNDDNGNAGPSD